MHRSEPPPLDQLHGRPLGRILVKLGKVTRWEVSQAIDEQKHRRGRIGQILIESGKVTAADVRIALAAQIGWRPPDDDSGEVAGVGVPPDRDPSGAAAEPGD